MLKIEKQFSQRIVNVNNFIDINNNKNQLLTLHDLTIALQNGAVNEEIQVWPCQNNAVSALWLMFCQCIYTLCIRSYPSYLEVNHGFATNLKQSRTKPSFVCEIS